MNILEVKNISKSFDGKKVIDGVSFSVGEGKIVGLLGKNGSGKTTILKMINDLLTIDEGEIFVLGERISERTKAWVSFLSERNYLDGSWTVDRAFKFFEEFYPDFDRKRAESLLENLDIEIGVRLSKMSKGMKEKNSAHFGYEQKGKALRARRAAGRRRPLDEGLHPQHHPVILRRGLEHADHHPPRGGGREDTRRSDLH